MVLVSGIAVVDLIASGLVRIAEPGELRFCAVRPTIGGHACNVSVDLVRLGLKPSQLRAVFPVGRDVFGDFVAGRLAARGVKAVPVLAREAATSLDLILVARGEDRRYHVDPGANLEMTAAPVMALLRKERPRIFYTGGAGLLGGYDRGLAAVLRQARALGALTFVDAVSPYGGSWAFLRRALPFTDIFHCNADEALSLVGLRDAARAAEAIRRLGVRHVLVTLGGRGAVAAVAGGLLRIPAFRIKVVDPTGAGDAFSAGIILKTYERLRRGRTADGLTADEWGEILLYASACGAVCATGVGTTTAVRARAVEALMKARGEKAGRPSVRPRDPEIKPRQRRRGPPGGR